MLRLVSAASALVLLVSCGDKDGRPVDSGAREQLDSGLDPSTPHDPEGDEAPDADPTATLEESSDAGEPAELDSGADSAQESDDEDSGTDAGPPSSEDAGADATTSSMATWGQQPCDQESVRPGCGDESLALCICRGPDAEGGNEFCCSERWDYLCVDGVTAVPECKFVTSTCCEAHPTDGCNRPEVEQCVCAEVERMKREEIEAGRDPAGVHDCCAEGWTGFCAILADAICNAGCTAP
jgi:hypothetical protein